MATTLFDTVQQNAASFKQGSGPIQATSQEEMQKLAQNAGMPVTPSSPVTAQGIGANPDQAKMAGTPAQNNAAVQIATQPAQDLQTQLREAQARKQQSAAEAAQATQALKMEGFGSLGDRVQQIAQGMFNNQTATQAAVQVADVSKFKDSLVPGADAQQTTDLLNKVGAGTATPAEILQIAQNLGYKDTNDVAALTKSIKSSFLTSAEQTANFTAGAIPDNAMVKDLGDAGVKALGFASTADMAAALGIDEKTLSAMSIKDLQQQFGKEQMQDFGKVAAAHSTLGDPSSSRAEREAALQSLKELGATGVRAIEGDVQRMESKVSAASEVTFNGKQYTMDQLLSNDNITGLVKSYLADPDMAKAIQVSEPGFAAWIDQNQKVLATAAAHSDANVQTFADIQKANAAKQDPQPGVHIPTDTMKALYPGFGHLAASQFGTPPVASVIGTIPQKDAIQLTGTLGDLLSSVPVAGQGVAQASADELHRSGLDTAEGAAAYGKYAHLATDLYGVPGSDYKTIRSRAFPGVPDSTFDQIGQMAGAVNGFFNSPGLDQGSLDAVIQHGDLQRQALLNLSGGTQGNNTPLTPAQMAARGIDAKNQKDGAAVLSSVQAQLMAKQKDPLFIRYGQEWQNGDLPAANATKIGDEAQTGNYGDYANLRKLADSAKMNPGSRQILNDKLNSAAATIAQNQLNAITGTDRGGWDANMNAMLNSNPGMDIQDLQNRKTSTQTQLEQLKKVAADPKYSYGDMQAHLKYRIDMMQNAVNAVNKTFKDTDDQQAQGSGGFRTVQG